MSSVRLLCLALLISTLPTFAVAQAPVRAPLQGTSDEEAACRPDVVKFCRAAMPDTFRILACLQSNRAQLRQACKRVLANHGQ